MWPRWLCWIYIYVPLISLSPTCPSCTEPVTLAGTWGQQSRGRCHLPAPQSFFSCRFSAQNQPLLAGFSAQGWDLSPALQAALNPPQPVLFGQKLSWQLSPGQAKPPLSSAPGKQLQPLIFSFFFCFFPLQLPTLLWVVVPAQLPTAIPQSWLRSPLVTIIHRREALGHRGTAAQGRSSSEGFSSAWRRPAGPGSAQQSWLRACQGSAPS